MKNQQKFSSVIARAIICGALPDSAMEGQIITVTRNCNIIGSGESASWAVWTTFRENGKQFARVMIPESEIESRLAEHYPSAQIMAAGNLGKTRVFSVLQSTSK